MTNSSSGSINVTPLIDILLVLLIIFMVITPVTSYGLEAAVPRPATDSAASTNDTAVVVSVAANGDLRLNRESITRDDLVRQLRQHRTIFVQGAPEAEYQRVAEVIDLARGAGVATIGLMPR